MKCGGFLLLTLMLFFFSDVAAEAEDLEAYCSKFVIDNCYRLWFPVCASDGETYDNDCFFCKAYYESGKTLQLKYFEICK